MSSRSRRDSLRALADETSRVEALSTPRDVGDEISYPGVGVLLVSVAHLPSFGMAKLWEVRSTGRELIAYASTANQQDSRLVSGHERLAVPQLVLGQQINALLGQAIPIAPTVGDFAIADADIFLAKVGMGFRTHCVISWCSGYEPEAWKPVVDSLLALRAQLEAAQPQERGDPTA